MDEIMNSEQQSSDGRLVLRTEGLVKRYGKRTVANGVTINVKQGEIVGGLGIRTPCQLLDATEWSHRTLERLIL